MKTLFIQTHELASKLSPKRYLCAQLAEFIEAQTGRNKWLSGKQGFDTFDSASLVILSLLREQKEEFGTRSLDGYMYNGGLLIVRGFFLSSVVPSDKAVRVRQRLINSLLTRPDRTLCVLIPE